MKLDVAVKDKTAGRGLARFVQAYLTRRLTKYHPAVQSVTVCLDDANGPRGGLDKVCRMVVFTTKKVRVAVEALAESRPVAVREAVKKLERRLQKAYPRVRRARPADAVT